MLGRAIGGFRGRLTGPRVLLEPRADAGMTVTVYTDECVLSGRLAPPAAGPPDALAEWLPIVVRDVVATTLSRGLVSSHDSLSLPPHSVVAVAMDRPPDRYGSMRLCRVTVGGGPYFMTGSAHVLPGADPLASLRRRPQIELTTATIEYGVAGVTRRDHVARLTVTRQLIESIAEAN